MDRETDDVGRLLDEALKRAGLTQYAVAKRYADLKGLQHASGDQLLYRVRRGKSRPGQRVARELAAVFRPELDLPDDYFYRPRDASDSSRELAAEVLARLERLEERVAMLERAAVRIGVSL